MNIKFSSFIAALLLLSLSVGCGGNASVTGKVTFADGTPLTEGHVIFESSTLAARGAIQNDGTYSLRTGDDSGIPRGSYQVSITGFGAASVQSVPGTGGGQSGPQMRPVFRESPIDRKYYLPETSGLTCEVKGRTVYNITVEPPAR